MPGLHVRTTKRKRRIGVALIAATVVPLLLHTKIAPVGFSANTLPKGPAWPPVTVQVVTYGRPQLLREALEQIGAQDYPGDVQVVVVDDSPESASAIVEKIDSCISIDYLHMTDRRYTIGEKRNIAVDHARGQVMCVWDDDDIFPVDRIRQQVARLMARASPCSSIGIRWVYSLEDQRLSRCVGLPYPLENTFMFWLEWLSEERRFHHTNFAYMEHLFDNSDNWYSEAQPLSGEEMPFLYVRIASPTASLLPGGREFCVTSIEESLFCDATRDGPELQIDTEFIAFARAIMQGRFPQLQSEGGAGGEEVLNTVREIVGKAVANDLDRMSSDSDLGERLAPSYAARLGLGPDAKQGCWRCFGPAGEQPEGYQSEGKAPYGAPSVVDASAAFEMFDAADLKGEPTMSAEEAIEEIRQALSHFC